MKNNCSVRGTILDFKWCVELLVENGHPYEEIRNFVVSYVVSCFLLNSEDKNVTIKIQYISSNHIIS